MPKIKMKGVPIFRIEDVAVAKSFYEEALGFKVDWEHYYEKGAPVYMQVSRAGLVLHLSQNMRFREGTIIFVETECIDELHDELSNRDGSWEPPPVSLTPWKTKQMEIEDPFGNLLRFNEESS